MSAYGLTHLSDAVLLRDLASLVARDRSITAAVLAHIAEVDARRLYLPAGYTSMHAYCVGELHLSEDAAYKRIRAARAARQFPTLFPAVADGRLHLAGVCLLAPHLTRSNADELLAAASFRSKDAIEELLARRFPPPEVLVLSTPIPSQLAPGRVDRAFAAPVVTLPAEHAPEQVGAGSAPVAAGELAPGRVGPPASDGGRFLVQLTIGQATVEGMRLRCRPHNQYEAERAFGTEFMTGKRGKAREAAEAARQAAEASRQRAAERAEPTRDVIGALRGLGARADEARRAAESAESLAGTTLEERLRAALKSLGPRPKAAPVAPARAITVPPSPVAAGTAEGAVAAGVSPA